MSLNRRRKIQNVLLIQRISQHRIGADDAGDRACRGRTQTAGLRNCTVLHDFETVQRLAADIIDLFGALINQIAFIRRDIVPMGGGDVNRVALLHIKSIVQVERNADGIVSRSHVGACRRNSYLNHAAPLTEHACSRRHSAAARRQPSCPWWIPCRSGRQPRRSRSGAGCSPGMPP